MSKPQDMELSASDIIITNDDINVCRGSGELLPCPFCGHKWPMSFGEKTANGKAICWKVQCTHSSGLVPDCCASVWDTQKDQHMARENAVAKWNRRPANDQGD